MAKRSHSQKSHVFDDPHSPHSKFYVGNEEEAEEEIREEDDDEEEAYQFLSLILCLCVSCLQAKVGFVMNIAAVLMLTLAVNSWGEAIFGFSTLPDVMRNVTSDVMIP